MVNDFGLSQERRYAIGVALLGLILAMAVFLYLYDAAQSRLQFPCVFHELTGLYCPGCGSGRATHALLHGDILTALRYNVFAVVGLPLILYSVTADAASAFGTRWPRFRVSTWTSRAIVVGVAAFTLLRNIPSEPFTCLAP